MGLDMYLTARRYIGGWDHTQCVAYWRKANAIHKWFVDHVQDGKDECQESNVGNDQLKKLRDLCKSLIESHDADRALKELPPQEGFFFGTTDLDEWYWGDLEYTEKTLTTILENPKLADYSFQYHASW